MMKQEVQKSLVIEPIFAGTNSLMRPKRQIERLLLKPRETAKALSIYERTLYTLTKRGD